MSDLSDALKRGPYFSDVDWATICAGAKTKKETIAEKPVSEMKLRVARRLWNAQHPLAHWDSDIGPTKFEQVKMLNLAQIAIEAMREPTDAMLNEFVGNVYMVGVGETEAEMAWKHMIDGALKD